MSPHVDPDDLALVALGEPVDLDGTSHLAGCAQCQSDLDQLRAVVASARTVTAEDSPQAPPARVWDGVRTELGLDAAPGPVVVAPPRRADRRTTWGLAAAAVVVGIVLGAVGTALLTRSDDGSGGADERVVASTRLSPLPEHSGSGDAEVIGTGRSRVLELDVTGLSRGDGVYEVWLLAPDAKHLVSVGLLGPSEGTRARFPLPPGLDLAEFPVVDVSLEPVDGNPAHSGDSVVRGTLTS
jgi:anti-sigma-K factor RskA